MLSGDRYCAGTSVSASSGTEKQMPLVMCVALGTNLADIMECPVCRGFSEAIPDW